MNSSYFSNELKISEAFEQFSEFDIEVKCSDSMWGKNERTFIYNKEKLPNKAYIPCSNELCQRGGLSLYILLDKMFEEAEGEYTCSERYRGDHGSKLGKRKGNNCSYKFEYKLIWKKQ